MTPQAEPSRRLLVDEAPLSTSTWPAFGLGSHVVDDRLRLFSWATSEHRLSTCWSCGCSTGPDRRTSFA